MKAFSGNGGRGRSRYVNAGEAKQYELTFIGRMETKIGDFPTIRGRVFRVEGIEEDRGAGETGNRALPENRALIIRLTEKKLLGRKMQYVFNARYASRVERYADPGYDCDPLTLADVTVMLAEMQDRARSAGIVTVLCLASPTGFEQQVQDFINGEEFHRNYISSTSQSSFLMWRPESSSSTRPMRQRRPSQRSAGWRSILRRWQRSGATWKKRCAIS
ncbi:MAG: hypothetical protein RQM90_15200 [Methanoculleus sp.]